MADSGRAMHIFCGLVSQGRQVSGRPRSFYAAPKLDLKPSAAPEDLCHVPVMERIWAVMQQQSLGYEGMRISCVLLPGARLMDDELMGGLLFTGSQR